MVFSPLSGRLREKGGARPVWLTGRGGRLEISREAPDVSLHDCLDYPATIGHVIGATGHALGLAVTVFENSIVSTAVRW